MCCKIITSKSTIGQRPALVAGAQIVVDATFISPAAGEHGQARMRGPSCLCRQPRPSASPVGWCGRTSGADSTMFGVGRTRGHGSSCSFGLRMWATAPSSRRASCSPSGRRAPARTHYSCRCNTKAKTRCIATILVTCLSRTPTPKVHVKPIPMFSLYPICQYVINDQCLVQCCV